MAARTVRFDMARVTSLRAQASLNTVIVPVISRVIDIINGITTGVAFDALAIGVAISTLSRICSGLACVLACPGGPKMIGGFNHQHLLLIAVAGVASFGGILNLAALMTVMTDAF